MKDLFDGRFPKPYCEGFAWVWLEAHADKDGRIETSYRRLGDAWGWNQVRVMRFLSRLVDEHLIETRSEKAGTVVSIEKSLVDKKARVTRRETPQKALIPEAEAKPATRGCRLDPAKHITADWGQMAVDEGMSIEDARRELKVFKDHWAAAPGQKGVKVDWPATWRNWVRRHLKEKRPRSGENVADFDAYAEKYGVR